METGTKMTFAAMETGKNDIYTYESLTKSTYLQTWKLAQNDIYNYGNWHKIEIYIYCKMTFTSIDPDTKVALSCQE